MKQKSSWSSRCGRLSSQTNWQYVDQLVRCDMFKRREKILRCLENCRRVSLNFDCSCNLTACRIVETMAALCIQEAAILDSYFSQHTHQKPSERGRSLVGSFRELIATCKKSRDRLRDQDLSEYDAERIGEYVAHRLYGDTSAANFWEYKAQEASNGSKGAPWHPYWK